MDELEMVRRSMVAMGLGPNYVSEVFDRLHQSTRLKELVLAWYYEMDEDLCSSLETGIHIELERLRGLFPVHIQNLCPTCEKAPLVRRTDDWVDWIDEWVCSKGCPGLVLDWPEEDWERLGQDADVTDEEWTVASTAGVATTEVSLVSTGSLEEDIKAFEDFKGEMQEFVCVRGLPARKGNNDREN